jgi:hypothetical protein
VLKGRAFAMSEGSSWALFIIYIYIYGSKGILEFPVPAVLLVISGSATISSR